LNSSTRVANAMSDELTFISHNYSSTNHNSSQLFLGNSRDHTSFMPRIRRLYMSLYSLRAGYPFTNKTLIKALFTWNPDEFRLGWTQINFRLVSAVTLTLEQHMLTKAI
jgi:hypothetical protein